MHYKANWLLILEDRVISLICLRDTHTLGGSEEYAYKTKPVIEKLDDGFRVERWHMNAEPPPYHKKVISNKADNIDRRNIGRMLIPGIFLLDTMFAPGKGAERGVQVEGTRQYRNAQFMTPETRKFIHFFLELSARLRHRQSNIALSLRNSLEEAFDEGQGDHRGAADGRRRRPELSAACHRRGCGSHLLPLGAGAAHQGEQIRGARRVT